MAVACRPVSSFLPPWRASSSSDELRVGSPGSSWISVYAVATEQDVAPARREVLPLTLRLAVSGAELRGAASLRSHAFLSLPSGRSPEFAERHRQMRAEDEWHVLEAKVAGREPGFKRVACLVALCDGEVLPSIAEELDPTCAVESVEGRQQWVVGTLDVNLGLRLPGEELAGRYPEGDDADLRRAYLSNVCVARAARRKGVAAALLEKSATTASKWGVEYLYVHVVAENMPARELYGSCGFVFEQEETAATARLLCRPRRFLLRSQLDSFGQA